MHRLKLSVCLAVASILFKSLSASAIPSEIMIDLVIVIQTSIFWSKENLDGLKENLLNLSDHFRFGGNFSRAALGYCLNLKCDFILDLTDDPAVFKQAINDLNETQSGSGSLLGPSIRLVGDLESSMRPRAVIIFSQGDISDMDEVRKEMTALQKNESLVYLVSDSIRVKNELTEILGNRSIFVDNYSQGAWSILKGIRDDLEDAICNYVPICRYESENLRMRCVGDWWNPLVQNDFDCKTIKSPPTNQPKKCRHIDCDRICDQYWPWSTPIDCRQCGPLNVTRLGLPAHKFLEQCPQEFICECKESAFLEEEPRSQDEILAAVFIGVGLKLIIIAIIISVIMAAKRRMARRMAKLKKAQARKSLTNLKAAPQPKIVIQKLSNPTNVIPVAEVETRSDRESKSGTMGVSVQSVKAEVKKMGPQEKAVKKQIIAVPQPVKKKASAVAMKKK